MNHREHAIELLLHHRWMPTLKQCSCVYGLGKPPVTYHQWAEHAANLIEGIRR